MDLPRKPEAWRKLCATLDVKGFGGVSGKADERLRPGSNINSEQFIALRILCPNQKNGSQLNSNLKNRGGFQALVCPDSETSVAHRTRSKDQSLPQPERPRTPPQATRSIKADVEEINKALAQAGLGSPIQLPSQSLSPVSPEQHLSGDQGNEVTVNTALIHFCSTLDLFNLERSGLSWSYEQKAFKFVMHNGGNFVARVDGILELVDNKQPLAVVEVKAGLRARQQSRIVWQEGAELVAWIMSWLPLNWDAKGNEKKTFRRLLISQDHHEMYFIVAEFTPGWIKHMLGHKKCWRRLSLHARVRPFPNKQSNPPHVFRRNGVNSYETTRSIGGLGHVCVMCT
ncbi:hypothetical protein CIB48_g4214 [Xylaria polymorpha]|nr:hypothetical protein CIB48_g4214 [Xylaria polymorpha]